MPSCLRYKAVLIDLSGTLHIDRSALPCAAEALKRLRQEEVKLRFITNTTKESLNSLYNKLTSIGFNIDKNEIFTSLSAAYQLVKSRQLRPMMFLEESAKEDFKDIPTDNPNCVLIGLSPTHFNYNRLTEAFRLLIDGAPLIAIHKARYFKQKDQLSLGPGAFVAGLEYSAGCRAEVVGKPQKAFFHQVLDDLGCDAGQAVMIGDDVIDDINGATQAGMDGILVRTGKYRVGDEQKLPTPLVTNGDKHRLSPISTVCQDFNEAVQWILKQK